MKTRKRSNAPIFWGLFGAGGMIAALVGPMLVFITGIAVPLGIMTAAYLAEIAASRTRRIVKPFVELLAALPSVSAKDQRSPAPDRVGLQPKNSAAICNKSGWFMVCSRWGQARIVGRSYAADETPWLCAVTGLREDPDATGAVARKASTSSICVASRRLPSGAMPTL